MTLTGPPVRTEHTERPHDAHDVTRRGAGINDIAAVQPQVAPQAFFAARGNNDRGFHGREPTRPLECYIILGCGSNSIRWSPPLIMTKEHIDVALEIFDAAIAASI